jgi:hypothetical protein
MRGANLDTAYGGEPPRENVQQQPRAPEKTGRAVHPSNPIAGHDYYNADAYYRVREDPIETICGLLRLCVYVSVNHSLNPEGRNCHHKCQRNVRSAPPFRER